MLTGTRLFRRAISMGEPQTHPTFVLSARGISKQFAGIEVLSDVDVDLERGEIHALLGENGAGKSTFAKILAGVHRPTRGSLLINGETRRHLQSDRGAEARHHPDPPGTDFLSGSFGG